MPTLLGEKVYLCEITGMLMPVLTSFTDEQSSEIANLISREGWLRGSCKLWCTELMMRCSAAPQGFSPHQDDTNIGWPVAISISNDTTSMIGWNVSSAIHEGKIKWTSEVDVDLPDHQLWLVCKGWWHRELEYQSRAGPHTDNIGHTEHENHWHGPQYYGRNCLL